MIKVHFYNSILRCNSAVFASFLLPALSCLHTTWWHIAEVAAFQHFINASNDRKNTQIFIPRGKAAILAICSLNAVAAFPKNCPISDLIDELYSASSLLIFQKVDAFGLAERVIYLAFHYLYALNESASDIIKIAIRAAFRRDKAATVP